MANPLVAQREDSTTAISGLPLLESANDLKQGIESGDWASVAMGAVGVALDALSMAMDPFGSILAAGVGWLIEHVGPLSAALDALTGDADQIKAQSQTWANVAKELGAVGEELADLVKADLQSWSGNASDQYRRRAADTVDLLTAAQKGCEGASSGVKTAGEVVAAVRMLVRDIIAELVGHLISWALQVVFTLGIGLTWVVPQVVAAVAKTASKIADITKKLVKALKALVPLLKKAGTLFDDAAKALRKIKPGKTGKVDPPPKIKEKGSPDGPGGKKDKPHDDDSTSTSSAGHGDGKGGDGHKSGDGGGDKGGGPKNDGDQTSTSGAGSGGGKGDKGGKGGGNDTKAKDNPDRSTADKSKNYCGDPIDVATGEVVMTQVDVTLPGAVADLELSRTHLSSYRAGRWFGPSWTSTWDQRLELDAHRVRFHSEDGMVLDYPVPGDEPVLPVQGPRHRLRRVPQGFRLSLGDRELHFAGTGGVLPVTAIEQDGERTEIEYAADGSPTVLRRPGGVEIVVGTERGRIVALGAPGQPPVVRFSYNRHAQLSTVTDFAGRSMALDYDFDHRLVGWQDRVGTWYRYVYDDAGRCVRAVGANGYYNAAFAYEPGATRHTDAVGHTWTYRLNAANQLIERIDPLGNSRRYEWNRRDELLSQVDELGRETRYDYDDDGLVAVHRPEAPAVRLSPAEDGAVWLRAGEGDDEIERLVFEFDPVTTLLGNGLPVDVLESPDPFEDAPVTDRAARPGDRDLYGRPRLAHTASGAAARLGWTADGRRAWRLGPHGGRETWVHDAEGNVVEYRDAAGAPRRRKHGPFGLVLEETDAAGARTLFTYDGELRLTSVTNPAGLTWHYVRDAAGRLVEETDFDGRRTTYAHDAAGQLRRMTTGADQVVEYDYDLEGNVVARRTPDDVTSYVYDALGRLVVAENAESRVEIRRDGGDRVIADTINGLGVCWRDEGDAVIRRTSSGVDSEWRFTESGLRRSLRIAGHDVEFAYDDAEREVVRSVDGEVVLRRRFDEEDRLAEEDVAGVGRRTYRYRPDGRLAGVDDTIRPWQLSYDAAGRVSEAHGPGVSERFTRDAAGNITSATAPSPAGSRGYERNRLARIGDIHFEGDEQGRVTGWRHADRSCGYEWDHLDRLRSARTPDGALWTYHYDPIGRRFAKRCWVSGPEGEPELTLDVRFLWSELNLVEQVEHRPADGSYRFLTWERFDDDRPVVQVEHAGVVEEARFRVVITSPAGTPTELLDERGTLVWQDRSSFWGVPLAGADTAAMPLAFPGQSRDEETGLHYNVFRYYDPRTTRYLSQDPLGLAAAPNPVGYVDQPLLDSDPLGLAPQRCFKGKVKDRAKRLRDRNKRKQAAQPATRKSPRKQPIRVDNMTKEEFEKFKPELDKMLKADKHFFWSGGLMERVPGKNNPDKYLGSMEDKATEIAKKHGGNTLEGTLKDNNVKMPGWIKDPNDPRRPLVQEKWDYVSETFAKNSEAGKTHVVFPSHPGKGHDVYPYRRPDNVFDVTEYPRLKQDGKGDITKFHDRTDYERPYRAT
ncbi:type IV secretion protein Rhs [Amycolatopsis sp. NBRC 101858]|uniref:DUF6531 domain-containing protein n=1 Tax=Amycolatopsis sp. NBRC 101858 TaxID=3032200 RepID=UPI00249FE3E9|nr:DUF6531 domain-containing protein [Amycolatopsis sp. NBRC 101858]GLY40455.1 type IV secretion protein Rhs [Amycolatopsis sp. NBRC 101858]